ncbi:hypothetical protein CDD81_1401 [Ophiocordyceps australis]|uniref:Uncharacterized protein n=1 Tax=Ophiocordyceps australis TaxID=1399860 RepID=A0A2C5Y153_9HYPO|nr:hypothetical protein CDD81_1401 [Ophiocordyceps australis]
MLNSERDLGGDDPEINTLSSVQHRQMYSNSRADELSAKGQMRRDCHGDITFKPVPADYTSHRIFQLLKTGGDESC